MPRELDVRLPSRTAHNWQAIARIRDGIAIDQARVEASTVARRIASDNGLDQKQMQSVIILPLKDALTSEVKPALLVLFGVAGLLLLVACANVVNLSLAQASARGDELAVRVALGASRWRFGAAIPRGSASDLSCRRLARSDSRLFWSGGFTHPGAARHSSPR
jgi:hypothetical protein